MHNLRLLCLLVLLGVISGCGRPAHPTDERLIQTFNAHQADFESLLGMLRKDRQLVRVDDSWTQPENPESIGVPAERIREYRQLFAKLGIPRGFSAFHEPERFRFWASTKGLSIGGSSKGYAYLQEKPELIVPSLDTYQPPDKRSYTAYRHLKDNWYLYLDYED